MKYCGVILAGGKSTRMGKEKALLPLHHKPVICHVVEELERLFDSLIVISNNPSAYSFLQIPVVADRYPNMGPLAGMETAMFHQDADIFGVAACDMPFINHRIYRHLLGQAVNCDAVVPMFKNRVHPLAGVYKKSVHPIIQQQLDQDIRKVKSMFNVIHVEYVKTFDSVSGEALKNHFFNMNDPAQYEWAKKE